MVVVSRPINVPYAVSILPNSRVYIESPPEHVLHSDELGIDTVYNFFLRIIHPLWLPWRVCEGRQNENGRREPTMKQNDSDRLFPGSLEHRGRRSQGSRKTQMVFDDWKIDGTISS